MTLAQLNASTRDEFVAAIGWIYEHSPWVAERTWTERPFADTNALKRAMVGQVTAASREEQLALLRAHPDLGARVAMSEASVREQSGAGLAGLDAARLAHLRTLNDAYRARFGFPFLYAVKGASPEAILAALEARVHNAHGQEFDEALHQVHRIAGFRLADVLTEER
jgi:OHCU decarboxylase